MSELSTADRLAIHEVLYRYSHYLDHGRWDDFATLFSDDCCLDLTPVLGRYEGAAGIRQFTGMIGSLGLFMRHLVTNITVDGDDNNATVAAYVMAITGSGDAQRQSAESQRFLKRNVAAGSSGAGSPMPQACPAPAGRRAPRRRGRSPRRPASARTSAEARHPPHLRGIMGRRIALVAIGYPP